MNEQPPIAVTFVCPYPVCSWPRCLQTPNGWQTWPMCRSAQADAIDTVVDAFADRIVARPASPFPKDAA